MSQATRALWLHAPRVTCLAFVVCRGHCNLLRRPHFRTQVLIPHCPGMLPAESSQLSPFRESTSTKRCLQRHHYPKMGQWGCRSPAPFRTSLSGISAPEFLLGSAEAPAACQGSSLCPALIASFSPGCRSWEHSLPNFLQANLPRVCLPGTDLSHRPSLLKY